MSSKALSADEIKQTLQDSVDKHPYTVLDLKNKPNFSRLNMKSVPQTDVEDKIECSFHLTQMSFLASRLADDGIDIAPIQHVEGNPKLLVGPGAIAVVRDGDYLEYLDHTAFQVENANLLRTFVAFQGGITAVMPMGRIGNVLPRRSQLLYDDLRAHANGDAPISMFRLIVKHLVSVSGINTFFKNALIQDREAKEEDRENQGDNHPPAYLNFVRGIVNVMRRINTNMHVLGKEKIIEIPFFANEGDDIEQDTQQIDGSWKSDSLKKLKKAVFIHLKVEEADQVQLTLLDSEIIEDEIEKLSALISERRDQVCVAVQYLLYQVLEGKQDMPSSIFTWLNDFIHKNHLPELSLPEAGTPNNALDVVFSVWKSDVTSKSDFGLTGGFLMMVLVLYGRETFVDKLGGLFNDKSPEEITKLVDIITTTLREYIEVAGMMFTSAWSHEFLIQVLSRKQKQRAKDLKDTYEKRKGQPFLLSRKETKVLRPIVNLPESVERLLVLPKAHMPSDSELWDTQEATAVGTVQQFLVEMSNYIKLCDTVHDQCGDEHELLKMTPTMQEKSQDPYFELRVAEITGKPTYHGHRKTKCNQALQEISDAIETGLDQVGQALLRVTENLGNLATGLLEHVSNIEAAEMTVENVEKLFTEGYCYDEKFTENFVVTNLAGDCKEIEISDTQELIRTTIKRKDTYWATTGSPPVYQAKAIALGNLKSMAKNNKKRLFVLVIKLVKHVHGTVTDSSTRVSKKVINEILNGLSSKLTTTDEDSSTDLVVTEPDDDEDFDVAAVKKADDWIESCTQILNHCNHSNDVSMMINLLVRLQHIIERFDLQGTFKVKRLFCEFDAMAKRHLILDNTFMRNRKTSIQKFLKNHSDDGVLLDSLVTLVASLASTKQVTTLQYINALQNVLALDFADDNPRFISLFGPKTQKAFVFAQTHDRNGLPCRRTLGRDLGEDYHSLQQVLLELEIQLQTKTATRSNQPIFDDDLVKAMLAAESSPFPYHLGLFVDVGWMLKIDGTRSSLVSAARFHGVVCTSPQRMRLLVYRRQKRPTSLENTFNDVTRGVDPTAAFLDHPERHLLWHLRNRARFWKNHQKDWNTELHPGKSVFLRQLVAEFDLIWTPQMLDRFEDDALRASLNVFMATTQTVFHDDETSLFSRQSNLEGAGEGYFGRHNRPMLSPVSFLNTRESRDVLLSWLDDVPSHESIESWVTCFPKIDDDWELKRQQSANLLKNRMTLHCRDPGLFESPVRVEFLESPEIFLVDDRIAITIATATPLPWKHAVDADVKVSTGVDEYVAVTTQFRDGIVGDAIPVTETNFESSFKQRLEHSTLLFTQTREPIFLGEESEQARQEALAQWQSIKDQRDLLHEQRLAKDVALSTVSVGNVKQFSQHRHDVMVRQRKQILGEDLQDLAELPIHEIRDRIGNLEDCETILTDLENEKIFSVIVSGNASGFQTNGGLPDLAVRHAASFLVAEHQSTKRSWCGCIARFDWRSFCPGTDRPRRLKKCPKCGDVIDRDVSAGVIQLFEWIGRAYSVPFLSHSLLTCSRYQSVLQCLLNEEEDDDSDSGFEKSMDSFNSSSSSSSSSSASSQTRLRRSTRISEKSGSTNKTVKSTVLNGTAAIASSSSSASSSQPRRSTRISEKSGSTNKTVKSTVLNGTAADIASSSSSASSSQPRRSTRISEKSDQVGSTASSLTVRSQVGTRKSSRTRTQPERLDPSPSDNKGSSTGKGSQGKQGRRE